MKSVIVVVVVEHIFKDIKMEAYLICGTFLKELPAPK